MKNFFSRIFGLREDGLPVPAPTPPQVELAVGMEVVFIDEQLNGNAPTDLYVHESSKAMLYGRRAVVVALEAGPGKPVALCFKEPIKDAQGRVRGHDCDGRVPKGHGWYARPEHVYTIAQWEAHSASTAEWRQKRDAAMSIAEDFIKR